MLFQWAGRRDVTRDVARGGGPNGWRGGVPRGSRCGARKPDPKKKEAKAASKKKNGYADKGGMTDFVPSQSGEFIFWTFEWSQERKAPTGGPRGNMISFSHWMQMQSCWVSPCQVKISVCLPNPSASRSGAAGGRKAKGIESRRSNTKDLDLDRWALVRPRFEQLPYAPSLRPFTCQMQLQQPEPA